MTPRSDQGVGTPTSSQTRDKRLRETFEGAEGSEELRTEAPMSAPQENPLRRAQRPELFGERPQDMPREGQRPDDASLGSDLKQTAQTAADALGKQATQFAQDIGHELNKTGEDQKMRGADAIRHVARAIDRAAAELESQSPMVAHTVHETARQVEGFSDNLSNRSVNELIHSATQLARAQPALFIGGSVVAGFALARFLMSSSPQRPNISQDSYHS